MLIPSRFQHIPVALKYHQAIIQSRWRGHQRPDSRLCGMKTRNKSAKNMQQQRENLPLERAITGVMNSCYGPNVKFCDCPLWLSHRLDIPKPYLSALPLHKLRVWRIQKNCTQRAEHSKSVHLVTLTRPMQLRQ